MRKIKANSWIDLVVYTLFVGVVAVCISLFIVGKPHSHPTRAYKINMGYKTRIARFPLTLISSDGKAPYRHVVYTGAWMGSVDEQTWIKLDSAYISRYRLNDFLYKYMP